MESPPRVTIVIWATDARLAEALCAELADPLRELRVLEDDGELAASGSSGALLVAEAGPRFETQRAFVRGPVILVDPGRSASVEAARHAYAVVRNAPEARLAVDRFLT